VCSFELACRILFRQYHQRIFSHSLEHLDDMLYLTKMKLRVTKIGNVRAICFDERQRSQLKELTKQRDYDWRKYLPIIAVNGSPSRELIR
jgi:hypothetical protein